MWKCQKCWKTNVETTIIDLYYLNKSNKDNHIDNMLK